jgi:hypothetical protein
VGTKGPDTIDVAFHRPAFKDVVLFDCEKRVFFSFEETVGSIPPSYFEDLPPSPLN